MANYSTLEHSKTLAQLPNFSTLASTLDPLSERIDLCLCSAEVCHSGFLRISRLHRTDLAARTPSAESWNTQHSPNISDMALYTARRIPRRPECVMLRSTSQPLAPLACDVRGRTTHASRSTPNPGVALAQTPSPTILPTSPTTRVSRSM